MAKVNIEIRPSSIRFRFQWQQEQQKVTLRNDDGSPLRPSPANEKYARRLALQIEKELEVEALGGAKFDMGKHFPEKALPNGRTVAQVLDVWLGAQRLAKSTLAAYGSAVKFWKESQFEADNSAVLGDQVASTVTLSMLLTALAMKKKLSGKTVNNYVSVLNESFALAVADGVLEKNIAAEIPRASYQKPPPDPFSLEEAEKIIAYAAKHYPEPIYNMVEAWFFTGFRTGELYGLRWISVDLASSYVEVSESTVMGEHKESTKTSVARNVMLNSRALAAYKRQAKHTRITNDFVFKDPRYGTAWTDERAFRRSYWEPALKTLGIRYRSPYTCRHTYATMMLMAGRTPAWCARQMGHSIEMFLKTYAKWLEGAQDSREMAGLESWLGSNKQEAGNG